MQVTMSLSCRLCVILSLATLCAAKAAFDNDQEVAVQNVFRHILKLQPPAGSTGAAGTTAPSLPPKHMMELYQKYAMAGGARRMSGNTVRSILPTLKGSTPTSELLVFNVTCIEQSEEVNLAQLHLHRRRLPRKEVAPRRGRTLEPPYRVRIYHVLNHRSRSVLLANLPVAQHTRGGWHTLDVTSVLRELLLSTSSSPLQLGVRFEAPRNRPIAPDRFLKTTNETSAFLVVFSDDNSLLGEESRARNPLRHTHTLATMIHDVDPVQSAFNSTENDDFYLKGEDRVEDMAVDSDSDHNSFESFVEKRKSKLEAKQADKKSKEVTSKSKRRPYTKNPVNREFQGSDNSIGDTDDVPRAVAPVKTKKAKTLDEPALSDLSKKSFAARRRRIHPKTRYRVRQKDDDVVAPRRASDDGFDNNVRFGKRSVRSTATQMERDDTAARRGLLRKDVDNELMVGGRVIRSITDNELPDAIDTRSGEIPKSSPQTLLKSRTSQEAGRRGQNVIPLPGRSTKRWRGSSSSSSSSSSNGVGGGGGRKRSRGKKRDNKHRGKKVIETRQQNGEQDNEEWHENSSAKAGASRGDSGSSCRKNKLVVDFADIGWADWIISPQKFEAHYCAGQCVYPLTKTGDEYNKSEECAAMKPTNHATIQSLVHAIGSEAHVPDPCCVPDKLSAMSLLYLDDNNNVVLRSYHDMTVDSCACR